jgi:ABC-type glycerol-3-phosphate transport system substrate-binding protein
MRKAYLILFILMTLGLSSSFATTTIEFYTAWTGTNCYGNGSACHIIITLPDVFYPGDAGYHSLFSQYGENMPHDAVLLQIPSEQIGTMDNWEFKPILVQFKGKDGKHHLYALPRQKAPYDGSTKSYIGYAIQLF